MTDIETLNLKDTALINEICDLGDIVIDKNRRWSIEFDDYGLQGVIDAVRKKFVEQACEAIYKTTFSYGCITDDGSKIVPEDKIIKAIQDKFKC